MVYSQNDVHLNFGSSFSPREKYQLFSTDSINRNCFAYHIPTLKYYPWKMTNFSTIKLIFSYSYMYYGRYITYILIYKCMYICKQYYKSVIISRDFQQKKGEDALHNCTLTGKLRSHDHHSLLTVSIRILQSNRKGADIRFTVYCMQQLNFFS